MAVLQKPAIRLTLDKTGVLQHNFDANGNQNQATDDVSVFAHGRAQAKAGHAPEGGNGKGHHPNHAGGQPDIGVQKGQANAHSQGINAGCHGQHGHFFGGIAVLDAAGLLGLPNHIYAQIQKQGEGQPVVVGRDVFDKGNCPKIANNRHQKLKKAKPSAKAQCACRPVRRAKHHAAANGHRKGIHGQAH